MSQNMPAYAIAFYTEHIDFFERKIDSYWKQKDRIDIATLNASDIALAVQEHASLWKANTTQVSCWLPENLALIEQDKNPLTPTTLRKRYLKKLKKVDEDDFSGELLIASRPKNAHGKYEYLMTDYIHAKEATAFLEANGFSITSLARVPSHDKYPNPPLFPVHDLIILNRETTQTLKKKTEDGVQNHVSPKAPKLKTGFSAWLAKVSAILTKPRLALGLIALMLLLLGGFIWTKTQSLDPNAVEITQSDALNNPVDENDAIAGDNPQDTAEEDEPLELLAELPVSPFNFVTRPDDHDEKAKAILDALPNIVMSTPDFKTIDRPDDIDERYALLTGPKIKTPPTRNEKKLASAAKIIDAKRIATEKTQTAQLRQPVATEESEGETETMRLPSAPTKGSLAQIATVENAVDLSDLFLLGIYGPNGRPVAMIRSAGGRVTQAKKGDSVDGWQVVAISKSEVIVNKAGQQKRLRVPGS